MFKRGKIAVICCSSPCLEVTTALAELVWRRLTAEYSANYRPPVEKCTATNDMDLPVPCQRTGMACRDQVLPYLKPKTLAAMLKQLRTVV
jgi:hypothetical protein